MESARRHERELAASARPHPHPHPFLQKHRNAHTSEADRSPPGRPLPHHINLVTIDSSILAALPFLLYYFFASISSVSSTPASFSSTPLSQPLKPPTTSSHIHSHNQPHHPLSRLSIGVHTSLLFLSQVVASLAVQTSKLNSSFCLFFPQITLNS
jgi:hypothetical protein